MSTATVETLTAEVRVLMVGNRQVTLSVYRQLDIAPLEDTEPFGRVNDSKDEGLWVVGRERSTGVLVRAEYERHWRVAVPRLFKEDLTGPLVVCKRSIPHSKADIVLLSYRGLDLRVDQGAIQDCGVEGHGRSGGRCDGWQLNGQAEALDRILREHAEEVEINKYAADLPLIVLAGLR